MCGIRNSARILARIILGTTLQRINKNAKIDANKAPDVLAFRIQFLPRFATCAKMTLWILMARWILRALWLAINPIGNQVMMHKTITILTI